MSAHAEEFYVGYAPPPSGLARRLRRTAFALVLAAPALGVAISGAHDRSAPGRYEYGQPRPLAGWLRTLPYPTLTVAAAGSADSAGELLLVGPFKTSFEAPAQLPAEAPVWVELSAALSWREGRSVAEVVPGSVQRAPAPEGAAAPSRAPAEDGPLLELRGEILDSKCWTGAMKPGSAATHRACATLCIRSGVPPVLLCKLRGLGRTTVLLVDAAGRPVHASPQVLAHIAEPIVVEGRLAGSAALPVLYADLDSIRPVGALAE